MGCLALRGTTAHKQWETMGSASAAAVCCLNALWNAARMAMQYLQPLRMHMPADVPMHVSTQPSSLAMTSPVLVPLPKHLQMPTSLPMSGGHGLFTQGHPQGHPMDSKCEANGDALDIELGPEEHATEIVCASQGNATRHPL